MVSKILIVMLIVIIFFAIGIVGLFGMVMGLFKSPTGTTCRALSGFVCISPILSGNTLSVGIGQGTGYNWTLLSVFMNGTSIVNQTNGNITNMNWTAPGRYNGSSETITLPSDQIINVSFKIPYGDSSYGNIGNIYAVYELPKNAISQVSPNSNNTTAYNSTSYITTTYNNKTAYIAQIGVATFQ